MEIKTSFENNILTFSLKGRLDSVSSDEFTNEFEKNLTSSTLSVNIDLTDIEFVSSKGLRVLVMAYHKLDGKKLTLLNANPSVLEVLKLSGLLKVFEVK